MSRTISLEQARDRAARHGWTLTHVHRAVLGWVYLLVPPTGRTVVLYDLTRLDSYLPR